MADELDVENEMIDVEEEIGQGVRCAGEMHADPKRDTEGPMKGEHECIRMS